MVLIVLDAASAKRFGCYGYPKPTTPNLDNLASHAARFDSAYTQAVYTLASTASLMSGLYPNHHQILNSRNKLSSEIFTMAEAFHAADYSTGMFVANGNASDTFGMDQGFQSVMNVFRSKDYTGWGQDITDAFAGWLQKQRQRPFFAYLHYREPHGPYNPPEPWVRKFTDPSYQGTIGKSFEARIRINGNAADLSPEDRRQIQNLYDANLAYADSQVQEVLTNLKELDIYDRTIVIVTSDHGEAFWEHNFQGHNTQLYQESVHIPLIMKLAEGSQVSNRISNAVRTIDLYPTLVDLLDLSWKSVRVDGRSFLPYFLGLREDGRKVTSQVVKERQYAYVVGTYKYILSSGNDYQEIYNLKTDPNELQNLAESELLRASYYQIRLSRLLERNQKKDTEQKLEQATIDEAAQENLRALGYVGEQENGSKVKNK
ncbi:sulfatase [bacterium]|nr:sulfatase [bacterium]